MAAQRPLPHEVVGDLLRPTGGKLLVQRGEPGPGAQQLLAIHSTARRAGLARAASHRRTDVGDVEDAFDQAVVVGGLPGGEVHHQIFAGAAVAP